MRHRRMIFVAVDFMFLTPPTVEELQQSDLPELVDMLSTQAAEYSRLIKIEGVTSRTIAIRDFILNIQAAIDAKRAAEKKPVSK